MSMNECQSVFPRLPGLVSLFLPFSPLLLVLLLGDDFLCCREGENFEARWISPPSILLPSYSLLLNSPFYLLKKADPFWSQ